MKTGANHKSPEDRGLTPTKDKQKLKNLDRWFTGSDLLRVFLDY